MPYDVALLSGSVHLVRRLERKALFAGEVEIMVRGHEGWGESWERGGVVGRGMEGALCPATHGGF